MIISRDNIGVDCQFSPVLVRMGNDRGNSGYLIDKKDTRELICFRVNLVCFEESEVENVEFDMGEDVYYDIKAKLLIGAVPTVVNSRPLDEGISGWINFKKIKGNIMI